MRKRKPTAGKIAVILALPFLVAADPAPPSVSYLEVGEKAPALSVDIWVKGEAIAGFTPGQVYLVEFWGTWCAPCIETIPHLNALQQRFRAKGLTVVGVASHEFNGLEPVRKFVAEKGDAMNYVIGYDGDLSMEHAWQTHGEKDVIFRMPEAFLVDGGGMVVWKGHPSHTAVMQAAIEKALDKAANRQTKKG